MQHTTNSKSFFKYMTTAVTTFILYNYPTFPQLHQVEPNAQGPAKQYLCVMSWWLELQLLTGWLLHQCSCDDHDSMEAACCLQVRNAVIIGMLP